MPRMENRHPKPAPDASAAGAENFGKILRKGGKAVQIVEHQIGMAHGVLHGLREILVKYQHLWRKILKILHFFHLVHTMRRGREEYTNNLFPLFARRTRGARANRREKAGLLASLPAEIA